MREKKKNIPLGGAQDIFGAPFFPFLFPDLVIVTLWALFFWFLDVLSDCSVSDCSECPDEKKKKKIWKPRNKHQKQKKDL